MRPGGARAGVAGAALAAVLVAPGSWGQPPGSIPPVYTQRLQVPVRGDGLQQPRAVVADLHSGEVLVCDTFANRIAIFDSQGRFRYEIRGGAAFQSPIDLAVDPEGYLFVVSQTSSELTLLDFDGRLLDKISLTGLPDGLISPRFGSLALSPAGDRLYLMDFENDRLWVTDRQGAVQASVDTTVGRTPKEIEELRYGKVDVYGETVLLPIPNDGLVHMYDLEGRAKGTIGEPGASECQLMFPAAAALDEQGRALILDQQRAMFMTWDLERGACLSEHYGFGNAPGALYQPSDMSLDAAGRLYVSQGFEGRVQVYEGARPARLLAAATASSPEVSDEADVADVADVAEPAASAAEEARAAETAALAEVERDVRAWAQAWTDKRIDDYLSSYSAAFQPPRELDRSAWQRLRRSRLDRPHWIEVTLEQVEPRLTSEDRAQVSFVQTYRSDLYSDKVDKILTLEREADGWKILFERVVRTYRE
jgi:sugar lactone lactonase YvrE